MGGFVALGRNYINGSGLATDTLVWSDPSGVLRSFAFPGVMGGIIDALAEDSAGRILLGGSFSFGPPSPQLPSSVRFVALRIPDMAREDIRPPIKAGSSPWLRDVSFRSGEVGFAVGDGGLVFRTENGGLSWTQIATGVTNALFAVVAEGPVVDIVGSAGYFARRVDGETSWQRLQTGVDVALRSMIGLPTGDGLVVGDAGLLLLRTNDRFFALDSGTGADLMKVAGTTDEAYIGGRSGTILRLTTNGIAVVPSGTGRDLTGIAEDGTAVTDDGRVVKKGRMQESIGSKKEYSVFRKIGPSLWAGSTNGVVEKDFAVERVLPSTAPIVALVPMGRHVHAYAADGASYVMREAQSNDLAQTPFTLISPTNGQRIIKSNATFSLQSTGAAVTAAWLVQDRAQGGSLVQSSKLGKNLFGPARLYVKASDRVFGPVEIELEGPPELEGLGESSQPLRLLAAADGRAEFAPNVHAGGPLAFEWFKNGRRFVGATNLSLSVTGLSAMQAGLYQLVARSGDFSSTGAVTLIVTNASGATLLPRPADQVLYARESIQFQVPQVAEPYSSLSFVRISDGKIVGVAPTNSSDSGSLGIVLTNSSGRIVGISEPAEILVRNVTNRTIILSSFGTSAYGSYFYQGFYLVCYLAGGEESATFGMHTAKPLWPSGISGGFFFGAQIVQAGSSQFGIRFSFDSIYQPKLRGDRMGFSDPGNARTVFTLFYPTNAMSPSAPIFTNSPFVLKVFSTNGSMLPARFFFAPTVSINPAPARRSAISPLSNDVQLVSVINNSFGRAERVRLRFSGLGRDSNGASIRVVNASAEDQFGPYLDIGPVEAGVATNVLVRYLVPDGVTLPDPILRIDWPESKVAAFPSSTFLSLTPQSNPAGAAVLRFNTVRGWRYRVQSSALPAGPWVDFSDWIPGNDATIELPATPTSAASMLYWRVKIEAGEN